MFWKDMILKTLATDVENKNIKFQRCGKYPTTLPSIYH